MRLDRQHRKDAGHQIQNQAAQHGEQQQRRQRVLGFLDRLRQRCEARTGLDLSRAGAGKVRGDLDGNRVGLRAVLFGDHQHAADRARLCGG